MARLGFNQIVILLHYFFQIEEPENINTNSLDHDQPPPDSPTDKTDSDDLLNGDTMPPALHRNKTSISPSLQRILDGRLVRACDYRRCLST